MKGIVNVKLRGEWETGRVWMNEKELLIAESRKIADKSKEFSWGYHGSGPSQLALAICLKLFGKDKAASIYQDFKFKYVSGLPQSDFSKDLRVDARSYGIEPLKATHVKNSGGRAK